MTLDDLVSFGTILGVIIALITLLYMAYQIKLTRDIACGQFWLELEKMFKEHDEVHIKLRPGGDWCFTNKGPSTNIDWVQVEDYLGLFEHCKIMLDKGLIDWTTFKKIFGYRINNIMCNQKIVDRKLKSQEGEEWTDFIELANKLKTVK